MARQEAFQGSLPILVLKILARGPQHWYGIALRIEEISEDVLRVEEGSLYPALHRMEEAGWIRFNDSILQLTAKGRLAANSVIEELLWPTPASAAPHSP